jgi:predicted transcriptional regulator
MLTRAEAEVMKVLWSRGKATVHDVLEELPRPVAYTTILTVLRILEDKGFAAHEANPTGGRSYVYRALVSEQSARRNQLRDLIDRFFGGEPSTLAIGLIADERLTNAELDALRAHIDERLAKTRAARQPSPRRRGQPAKRGKRP